MPVCGNPILPPVSFDICAPSIRLGPIDRVYITRATSADVLANASSITEWNTRINQTITIPGTGPAPIRELTTIGSISEPEISEIEISLGRKFYGTPKNTLPFKIDELSLENIDFVRDYQEAGTSTVKIWFISGGLLFGGNNGIDAQIKVSYTIPESRTEPSTIVGALTWEGTQPEAIASPFA